MGAELRTIPALLRHHGERIGDAQALVHDDTSISYRELDERSRALAARLVAAGVGKRARVGVLMPNGIDWAVLACAVLRIGGVLVPLSTLLKPPELEAQLRGASVAWLIAERAYRGRDYVAELEALEPGLRALGHGQTRHPRLPALRGIWRADDLPTAAGTPVEAPAAAASEARVDARAAAATETMVDALEAVVRPADDMAIMFTSGSRGTPKGVVHTHGNALGAVASSLEARCVGPDERLYIPMPFFWMGGFGGGLLTALVAGATLLIETDPTPESTIAFLARERATLFRGWPDQAVKVASHPSFAAADLSSLRGGSLGAVLPESLRPKPGARANLFGMTETFGPYCGSRADVDMPESAFGSCGRPFEGVEVRIVDPETRAPLGPGVQGEIEVRGRNLMRGIEGRLREATFTRDGFYRTGDLGHLDDAGYLFYAGRTDDMFKVSGATVYPTEVEAALRSIPSVVQAYVTNVSDGTGELVGAAVVTRDGLTEDDLDREARARLSSFKVPRRWVLLGSPAEVPTMATGKVDKPGLQQLIRDTGRLAERGAG